MPNLITVDNDVSILENTMHSWATEPKPTPMLYHDDPLVLACASYRMWKETTFRWTALEDVVPKDVDYVTANDLRNYYRERLVFEALKNTNKGVTSEFRRKLGLLVNNELLITKQEVGLLMRMPYFYEEDLAVDAVVAAVEPTTEIFAGKNEAGEFKLVSRVLRSRRQGEYYDYWMTSTISPGPFKLVVKSDNVLRGLIEDLLETPVKLRANIYTKYMRGYHRNRMMHQVMFTGKV